MEEINLKEIFLIFWTRKWQIILIVILFIVIGLGYSYTMVMPKYRSSTILVLAKESSDDKTETITQSELNLNQKLVSTYSELIKSKSVLREVLNNLNIEDISEGALKSNITVTSVKNTELIEITVLNEKPEYSKIIADEIAKVFTNKVSEIYNINNVHVVDKAEVETNPYNVNHVKDLVMFIAIGFAVSCMYIFFANLLDNTIKTEDDLAKIGLTVLVEIPKHDENFTVGGNK